MGGVSQGRVSWGPFLGVSQEGSFFGVPGGEGVWGPYFWAFGLFWAISEILGCFGLFLGILSKNAVFDVLGLKCSKMSVFFIENNFWNNISARDAFPCVVFVGCCALSV